MIHNQLVIVVTRLAVVAWLATAAGTSARAAEPPGGLVLHYNFDQPDVGGLVVDRSGQNHNGHASDARFITPGKKGGGYALASGDSIIRVAGSPTASVKQATFAVWFKTSRSDATCRRILDGRAGQGYALEIGGGDQGQESRGRLAFSIGGGKPCLSDLAVTDGAWHHGAVTFDGENLRMYVDGQPQRQVTPCRIEIAALVSDLAIGMSSPDSPSQSKVLGFDGVIDELMIFHRALSAEEIRAVVAAIDPSALKPRFTKQQVTARLRQLKLLFDEGLLTEDFYARKVAECEAAR